MPKSKLKPTNPVNDDKPATRKMLHLVRDELKSDIRAVEHKMDAGFSQVDARFSQVDARFNQMDAKFNQMDSKFNQMDSKFSQMDAKFNQMDAKFSQMDAKFSQMDAKFSQMDATLSLMHETLERMNSTVNNIALRVEQQQRDNTSLYDLYRNVVERQDRHDACMTEIQETLRFIASSKFLKN